MRDPRPNSLAGTAASLRRSFDVYYRDRRRIQRMDALHASFVGSGSLAFDIGAHVGDRTGSFLRLGAEVVAVEPQPRPFRALQLLYGSNTDTALVHAAVGAATGTATLRVNSANPTVSTLSVDFVQAASRADGWQGQTWDQTMTVAVTTLDDLIAQHGVPDFVKIDVEGYERDVLEGLSTPLRALSFEVTTIQREVALQCIEALQALGTYRFNLSLGEEHRLQHTDWMTALQMAEAITTLPDDANSGDVYARLVSP